MATIVTRAGKGSALTHNEVDANFNNLNNDKIEAAQTVTLTNKTLSTGTAITAGTINGATIGATTPSSGAFTTLSATGVTTVQAGTVSAPAITTSGDTNTGIFFPAADTIAFTEGGTESLRLNSSGQIAVNAAGSASTPTITKADDLNTGIFYPAADTVAIGTGGTEALRVNSSQNVGIGTISPSDRLHIAASSSGAVVSARIENTNSDANSDASLKLITANGTFEFRAGRTTGALRIFTADGNERLRLENDGDTLFNTTSVGISNSLSTTIETSAANNSRITVNHSSTAGSSNDSNFMQFGYGGNLIGRIVQASTTSVSYTTTSDYRLKENVQPMTGALEKIAALKPCTYTWKSSGEASQGFLAHELQAVVPECVTGDKDAIETYLDEEGNEQTRPSYQGMDTSFLVATLTAAIQEQQVMIDELKAKVAALETA